MRSSWICIFSSCWINATSASIIQNSFKCLLVLLFSARNTGPKSNTRPSDAIAGSKYNCPDCDKYIFSPLTCSTSYNSVVPSQAFGVNIGESILVKSWSLIQSYVAWITVSLIRCIAHWLGARKCKCLISKRKSGLCSFCPRG